VSQAENVTQADDDLRAKMAFVQSHLQVEHFCLKLQLDPGVLSSLLLIAAMAVPQPEGDRLQWQLWGHTALCCNHILVCHYACTPGKALEN